MKKVYFIHENTVAYRLTDRFVDVPTDYVVTSGYIADNSSKSIWANPGGTFLLNAKYEGVYFETQEEGEKALVKLLRSMFGNQSSILCTLKELSEKYPEAVI